MWLWSFEFLILNLTLILNKFGFECESDHVCLFELLLLLLFTLVDILMFLVLIWNRVLILILNLNSDSILILVIQWWIYNDWFEFQIKIPTLKLILDLILIWTDGFISLSVSVCRLVVRLWPCQSVTLKNDTPIDSSSPMCHKDGCCGSCGVFWA